MRNVFMLYMPVGNQQALVHYDHTIKQKVSLDRIRPFVSQDLAAKLMSVFGNHPVAVWGSQGGPRNRNSVDRMRSGDDVLIIEGDVVRSIGKIVAKTENRDLSRELWKPLRTGGSISWELIYFIANLRELDVPFVEVARLFGFKVGYRLRGLTVPSSATLERFYQSYDDLYSVLVKLQLGEQIRTKDAFVEVPAPETAPLDLQIEKAEDTSPELVSDHIKMQWKLARLGIKAGERVWVPSGDQSRLTRHYQFKEFDPEFQAGIDLPHSYVENIDVVWKQEFRIGAAYEIENSTSIYSGLLRFADLNILAPNTLYPMFIVAPEARKNRVREQLTRPTFKRLDLHKKVRFLSYERIEEIDEFFSGADSGLTVDVVTAKSELVA